MFNIKKLMEQAQTLQTRMAEMEDELAQWQEVGVAGADMVKVTLNGKGDLIDIYIDSKILTPDQASLVYDLIKAASNNAKQKVSKRVEEYRSKVFSDIPMPPGMKLPF
ncbi:MAG: YbaB/EbfC family nucleoid-associated protein [Alphaproteobacteria bacterium]|nr:YbaB/EbfC family nucleoid-associated protein [Alphaproteobacteria bacterium]